MQKDEKKNLLFSITKKSFFVEYYNPGKNGGQNANKVATACIIHQRHSGLGRPLVEVFREKGRC
jgi:protein subunit release factor B